MRGGADARRTGPAARADIARIARKDLLSGCWSDKCDAVAHLLVERARGGAATSAERYLTVDDSDDSGDGRFHTRRGVAKQPTTSLSDLAARHESLAALRTLARRRPKAFRGSVDSCVPAYYSWRVHQQRRWSSPGPARARRRRRRRPRRRRAVPRTLPSTPSGRDAAQDGRRAFLEALDAAASRAPLCRLAGLCCARAPAQSVRNALPTLLPAPGRPVAPGADVRKAAVDGLVDVYRALATASCRSSRPCGGPGAARGDYVHRAGLSAASV